MKVSDLVDFIDNKGNKGTGVIVRIRDSTTLDLDVKRKNGRFQRFLSVPKESEAAQGLACWSITENKVDSKREESFKKEKETENQTFSSQKVY